MPTPASPLNGHPRTTPYRDFRAGFCKFGSSRSFSHHPISHYDGGDKLVGSNSTLILRESEIENWLMSQQKASEHHNISYLSSPDGFDSMMQILNQPHLSTRVIHQLVVLLTRTDFRTSMLKQATDKIYNALIGSPFLTTLHSHIGGNVKPAPECVEAYVFLCEELVGRTGDGWKEAPLDAVKTLIDKVEHEVARDLSYTIALLLDHKAKKMRMDAQLEDDNLGSNFRNLPIIPSKEQFLSLENPIQLPVTQVGLRYPSVAAYLDTQFRSVQEIYIGTLRDFVRKLCRDWADPDLHVYTNVYLKNVQGGNAATVYRVSFPVDARQRDRLSSKCLVNGSLLCISSDTFQTYLWAAAVIWTTEILSEGVMDIQLLEDSEQRRLETSKSYMMAVSSSAYFEAHSHVLKNLQRPEMDNLPFQEHLVSLQPHVKEPVYLKSRKGEDVYDFGCAFPLMKKELPTSRFPILQSWPEWTSSLDRSQMSALKHGLTKRLALIQGPPGTGKTFIGLLIVKMLLENLKQTAPTSYTAWRPSHLRKTRDQTSTQEKTIGGPILLICHNNHGLDNFLRRIYAHEKNVVRVGGIKSPGLEECNLHTLVKRKQIEWDSSRSERGYGSFLENSLYVNRQQGYTKKRNLGRKILGCAEMMNIDVATKASLHGVATEEQIRSLFYEGCNIGTVVNVWLHEREKETGVPGTVADGQFQESNAQSLMHSVLIGEEACHKEASSESTGGCGIPHQIIREFKGSESSDMSNVVEFHGSEEDLDESLHGDCFLSSSVCVRSHGDDHDEIGEDINMTGVRSSSKDKVKMILHRDANMIVSQRSEPADECVSPDQEWTEVKTRESKPYEAPQGNTTEMIPKKDVDVQENEWPLEMLMNHTNVWSLDGCARRVLHDHWLDTIWHEAQDKMTLLSTQYEDVCRSNLEVQSEIELLLLRTAKVVGMTTTVAARRHSMLKSLQAEIIIVEEAAEVLESHILGCLTASTKHLILIGDHLQFRPRVHKVALKHHHLDVSLFERLVKSGIEYVTLEVQRRMRPCISKLISSIYPMLKDHESVLAHDNIKGVKSNVFFFNHSAPEAEHRMSGIVNVKEAKMVVGLCDYFLKQGYTYKDITILSMYEGQAELILCILMRVGLHKDPEKPPQISTEINYQGKECKIIILSLVSSNYIDPTTGTSCLEDPSRVCVALSRAKDGLFIFGNGEVLSEKSELWKSVIGELKSSESYGDALVLSCQNHPETETRICKPADFGQVPDGGCNKACEHELSCGHTCSKRCHPGDDHGCLESCSPQGSMVQSSSSVSRYVPPMFRVSSSKRP